MIGIFVLEFYLRGKYNIYNSLLYSLVSGVADEAVIGVLRTVFKCDGIEATVKLLYGLQRRTVVVADVVVELIFARPLSYASLSQAK